MKTWIAAMVVGMLLSLVVAAQPPKPPPPATTADATYKEIKSTFGIVPTFLKAFPEEGIAAAWAEMRAVQLDPSTALSPRVKELIGLAVAAQIPCRYCTYFHIQAGRAGGATDRDLKEAVAVAAVTRHFSTLLYGAQIDPAAFTSDVAKMMAHLKRQRTEGNAPGDIAAVVDAPSAYKDMERTVGMVPSFMRHLPTNAVAPAWRMLRSIELSTDTSITPKDKELISLAVSAQIPCTFCVQFCTEAAKLHGATDAEIREAVAMSAVTRLWSTILNGSLIDEAQFRTEVDQVMQFLRRGQKAAKR